MADLSACDGPVRPAAVAPTAPPAPTAPTGPPLFPVPGCAGAPLQAPIPPPLLPHAGEGFAFVACTAGRSGAARLGLLRTPHGDIPTPAFAPVGTQGTVKGLTPDELARAGVPLILCNTYHLWLRPGPALVARHGGLHGFTGWHGPILTDSGGFQAMSLSRLNRIDDDGITFRSHLDGSTHRLTPEVAVAIQEALGADIAMVLDQCIPHPAPRQQAEAAVRRSLAWAERCIRARARAAQAQFAIVQGGVHTDLALACARALADLPFPGYAIGSLSVGEPLAAMCAALRAVVPALPADRPRYLMGVGSPDYLVEAVWHGVDLFDCVLPTRIARNGTALLLPAGLVPSETGRSVRPADLPEGRQGRLVVRNAAYAQDLRPLDPSCACPACDRYSRAYLRHLCRAHELLAPRLLSLHNLHTLQRLVRALRAAIAANALTDFREAFWLRSLPWSAANRETAP